MKQKIIRQNSEEREKLENGLGRHISLVGINEWVDLVGNPRGAAILKRYLNIL